MNEIATKTPSTMQLRTLASGSSGNATFLRIGSARILIDAGISCRRIRSGLESMGESIDDLSALIITHEHSDHIKGGEMLLKTRPELPVYATFGTIEGCGTKGRWDPNAQTIEAQHSFTIDDVEVLPFRTSHDAKESVGFRFETTDFVFGFATDLGRTTAEVVDCLKGCRALVLEANYDEQMLQWSPYPAFLKRRIAGRGGHLSNAQTRELLREVAGADLEQVVLGHLSEKNNSPERAVATVSEALGARSKVEVIAAARHEPGPVFRFRPRPRIEAVPKQGMLPI